MKFQYQITRSLKDRQNESRRMRDKYPDRVPIIVERDPKSDTPDIDKNKFLSPCTFTMGQFIFVIRKRMKLPPEKALYVFIENSIPPTAATLSSIYEEKQDKEDGFLYMRYSSENTFGTK